ncbi:ferrichrome ABC transporter permease, partial [Mesorhizobium sp. M00.F.Ca.ET.186.01.1.1]
MGQQTHTMKQGSTSKQEQFRSRPWAATLILTGGVFALILGMFLSVSFGAADIQFSVVWDAIFHFNPDITQHQIIQEIRLPRLLGGAMVG